LIASGTVNDSNVIARPSFTPTIAELVSRMRQGRTYTNLHTMAFMGGEIRGHNVVTDREPVSHYSDPEFSWKFEVAPASIGFKGRGLGSRYKGARCPVPRQGQ
jgi:hypothetical protein